MDAIMAMDGNGPRRGKPFHLGMLLFSSDPVAVDATACRLIGLNPAAVGLIRFGQEAGLGFYESDKIEIKGDYGKQTFPNFVRMSMPATMPFKSKWLQNSFIPRPRIDPETCAKCGVCVNMCPLNPPAVDWQDDNRSKIPAHSYKNCIRCFCCQEVCPEGAIRLQMPLPGRIFKLNRGK
jgi:Pyruvate/2-oxoacid:ferredoxin oxidoreductase delta subunit